MKYVKLFEEIGNKEKTFSDYMGGITDIVCCDREITSLVGIDKYITPSIKSLSCQRNKITTLEGLENTNFTQIDCAQNNLISLKGIENLKNLHWLNCGKNKLKNLKEIQNFVGMGGIFFHNNDIDGLMNLKNLINLERIDCSFNPLTSLEFDDFSIDAFELGIDKTDLYRFKKLRMIWINNDFSTRYEDYIRKYCKSDEILLIKKEEEVKKARRRK